MCVRQAIRDGVIEATVDHEQGFMQSKVCVCVCGCVHVCDSLSLQENTDIYSTKEPQEAFHQRIQFCLDLYNTSIRVHTTFPYCQFFIPPFPYCQFFILPFPCLHSTGHAVPS